MIPAQLKSPLWWKPRKHRDDVETNECTRDGSAPYTFDNEMHSLAQKAFMSGVMLRRERETGQKWHASSSVCPKFIHTALGTVKKIFLIESFESW